MFNVGPMALGKQVRRYRVGLGWTLDRLSEESQVDVGTISALEQRDSKRSQFGPALAKAFGLSFDALLDESIDHLPALLSGKPIDPPAPPAVAKAASQISPWPFARITQRDWRNLAEHDKGLVEAYAQGLLDAAAKHRKSHKTGTAG